MTDDILGQYDPVLDKHCMYTKSEKFRVMAIRVLKAEYQVRRSSSG